MKKNYYIIKKDGEYSFTIDLTDDIKDYVVFTGKVSEDYIGLYAKKKIGEFKLADGIIVDLPEEFIGKGEVDGFDFRQVYKSDKFYIYLVRGRYYEIFDKRFFGNKVKYPRAVDFGYWAWTFQKASNVVKFVREHYKETIDPAVLEINT